MRDDLEDMLQPRRYHGRAPEQVNEFWIEEGDPVLARYGDAGDSGIWEVPV